MARSPASRDLITLGLDRWLLAVAFGAGALGTVVLKATGAPPWMPAALAGGVILAYAAICWFLRSARLEPEQIGDNAYYLGFVLTLCSLAYTLWSLGTVEAETAFVAEVVAGFGVALTSTIVGVAVRVFLMQFRVDVVAREREAQLALGDAVSAFRSELADVIRGTRFLGVEIRQTLAQHHRDMAAEEAKRMRDTSDLLIEALDGALRERALHAAELEAETGRTADAAVARAAARVEAMADGFDRGAGAREAASEAVLDAASERAMGAAEARLEAMIARFEAAMSRSSAALAASTSAIGREAIAELRAHRAEARRRGEGDRPEPPQVIEGGR